MKTIFSAKNANLLITLLLLTFSFSACKKIDDVEVIEGDAKINVVNTIIGSTSQDVFQNSTKLNTTSLAYGQSTGYLTVKAGISSVLTLKNTGTETTTATSALGPQVGSAFTVFYFSSSNGGTQISGFQDDTVAPATGKIKVRFLNIGSIFSNTINVSVLNGSSIVTGLQFGYLSAYQTIDAGTDLNVSVLGGENKLIPATSFQTGKTYTVWFDAINATTPNYHIVLQN